MNELRKKRKEKGFSLSKLSKEASVSYSSLSRWENNWCLPTQETASKLANALGTSVGKLFPGENLKSLGG